MLCPASSYASLNPFGPWRPPSAGRPASSSRSSAIESAFGPASSRCCHIWRTAGAIRGSVTARAVCSHIARPSLLSYSRFLRRTVIFASAALAKRATAAGAKMHASWANCANSKPFWNRSATTLTTNTGARHPFRPTELSETKPARPAPVYSGAVDHRAGSGWFKSGRRRGS